MPRRFLRRCSTSPTACCRPSAYPTARAPFPRPRPARNQDRPLVRLLRQAVLALRRHRPRTRALPLACHQRKRVPSWSSPSGASSFRQAGPTSSPGRSPTTASQRRASGSGCSSRPPARPGWQRVGSAVTGPHGRVRFGAVRITKNTAFRLAVSGGADSSQVSVTAIPRVQLWLVPGLATGRLVAVARFGAPGDTVVLQRLSGGTWQAIATQTLGAAHRTVFAVPIIAAGADYRAVLQATSVHGAGMSGLVRQARVRSKIGAKAIIRPPRPSPRRPPARRRARPPLPRTPPRISPPRPRPRSPRPPIPAARHQAQVRSSDPGPGVHPLRMARAPRDGDPPRDHHEQEPREPRGTAGDKADD